MSWIRILTLNAHQGFAAIGRRAALPGMREAMRASGAELVFLQEIGAAVGGEPTVQQYEFLADGVWSQHAYGRNAVVAGGHHGNAILSKFPIASSRNVDASIGNAEPRGFLHAEIELPGTGRRLHAICVHLALREAHRRLQAGKLLEIVARDVPADEPLVIAGDFNDWLGHAHRLLQGSGACTEVYAAAHGRPARTFPALAPLLRLDRIYVKNARHRPVATQRADWSRLSDHAPLAAEIMPSTRAH